ncbi:PRC-barrel domain-containing protein [uncultured Sphingomonas sp.]|uniref:PRC-barrel domain-containing protein n=1 Tax=uncultured Sphingomonas sp. TaxID=158754 RepID=UPI0025ED8619|nr:PRC-barrel domain-containing protein [uncultured Sphingomonas sp.]
MTAANLGPRVTGWGFVVFTIGAIAWVIVGIATNQQNLLISNAFLLLVDVVGVWRWLGRRARYDSGAEAARQESVSAPTADLFALSKLEGMPVRDGADRTIANVVEAMATCDRGSVSYLVVCEGGIGGVGERLHALRWSEVTVCDGYVRTRIDAAELATRTALEPGNWPTAARSAHAA